MFKPATQDSETSVIAAKTVRYIKLGKGGAWERASLDQGRIYWGLPSDPHEEAHMRDWSAVREAYARQGRRGGSLTREVNESKEFYDQDPDVLWITFARNRMWWAFAEPEVRWVGGSGQSEGTRYRRTVGGWSDCDLHGRPLNIERLSSSLTQLAAYRRTICNVGEADYCLRMINAGGEPLVCEVEAARNLLESQVALAVARLSPADFELLVELILSSSGWRRVSKLGGPQKDIDLVVEQPFTGDRMLVQVKSKADQSVVDDYAQRLCGNSNDSVLFACHSPQSALTEPNGIRAESFKLMLGNTIAKHVIGSDLIDWVMDRAC